MEILNLTSYDNCFITTSTVTPSGAAAVLTLQSPAGVNTITRLIGAYMYCSVSCTVTLEIDGTAASATLGTIINVNVTNPTAQATDCQAFSSSNVGVGTVVNTYNLAAGQWISLDLTQFALFALPLDNITLRTSSITGTATLQFMWREM